MIKILADQNLYKIKQFIPTGTTLTTYDPDEGIPEIGDADAMLVRTVTQLNRKTLQELPSKLSFIGTGSSGSDHIESDYFEAKGITVADAKGCNARAVAEYVMTALLIWQQEHSKADIPKVGIIGVGKAGTAVQQILDVFGIEYVLYDPPRAEREENFVSATQDELLAADILTFHIPLTHNGTYSTFHWLDEDKLREHHFELIINASRGGVADELKLMKAYVEGRVQNYILDVWENEPDFNAEIAKHAFLATPHIAGYSEQAKLNASRIICDKLARHFGIENRPNGYQSIPEDIDLAHIEYDLKKLLTRLHPILEYDQALRDLAYREDKMKLFRTLRTNWPFRFEYPMIRIRDEILSDFEALKKLGIKSLDQAV